MTLQVVFEKERVYDEYLAYRLHRKIFRPNVGMY